MGHRYPQMMLKAGRERSLLKGHPWIFSGAVATPPKDAEPGQVVCAVSHDRQPLALGFFNPSSDIVFRAVTSDTEAAIGGDFWRRRLRSAAALRQRIVPPDTTACRLVNAEGDGMPGLILDRYGDCLVVGIHTMGIEHHRDAILHAITEECRPLGIYERSEGPARRAEGLSDRSGTVFGEEGQAVVEIIENGLRFQVDIVSGQKTGFFLDQRDSRMLVGSLARGADVLNCFSYTGAFSVYAARGGARRVVSVEASATANEAAASHLAVNGLSVDENPIIRADVFQYLRKTEESFDLIILDPPAFAKAKRDIRTAARGYKDINLQALKRLREGGLLATFSCSNYIDEELFGKIVLGAAEDAHRPVRLLKRLGPGPDHPTNLAHTEGRYLKGLLLGLLD